MKKKEKAKVTQMKRVSKKEIIAGRLTWLARKSGRLTPELVVRDAEDARSPLHSQFEWDDSKAAEQYRLEQARDLIRSVELKVTTTNYTYSTVGFVRDPDAGSGQGYIATQRLRMDRRRARDAFDLELVQVVARMERARNLAKILRLEAVWDALIRKMQKISEKVAA